jgi:hypothetical protein
MILKELVNRQNEVNSRIESIFEGLFDKPQTLEEEEQLLNAMFDDVTEGTNYLGRTDELKQLMKEDLELSQKIARLKPTN